MHGRVFRNCQGRLLQMKTQHAPNWSQCFGIWEKANFHSAGKSHRFPCFVSVGPCVLHNSAFYCRERLRPRRFNYQLSVDDFPDSSSWVFMLGSPHTHLQEPSFFGPLHSNSLTSFRSDSSPLHTHLHYLHFQQKSLFHFSMNHRQGKRPRVRQETRIATDPHFR